MSDIFVVAYVGFSFSYKEIKGSHSFLASLRHKSVTRDYCLEGVVISSRVVMEFDAYKDIIQHLIQSANHEVRTQWIST